MARRVALSLVLASGLVPPPSHAPAYGAKARSTRFAVPLYHAGEVNHCPTCGLTGWSVGRLSAECSGCGMPLSIAPRASRHSPF